MRNFFKLKSKHKSQRVNHDVSKSVQPYRGVPPWAREIPMDRLNHKLIQSIKAKDIKMIASVLNEIEELKKTHNDLVHGSCHESNLYHALYLAIEAQTLVGDIAKDIIIRLIYRGARLKIDEVSNFITHIELTMSRVKLLIDYFSDDETMLNALKEMLSKFLLKVNKQNERMSKVLNIPDSILNIRHMRINTYAIAHLLDGIDDAIESLKSPEKAAEL
jgi:hypothetical protein